MKAVFVTTTDNPYDYFTQFDQWYAYDIEKGYNTCSYVDRVAMASYALSDMEYQRAISDAVDDIVRLNVTGNYKRITTEIPDE